MAIVNYLKDSNDSVNVFVEEEKLTDGSLVYAVTIHQEGNRVKIDCVNEEAADRLFNVLATQSDYLL